MGFVKAPKEPGVGKALLGEALFLVTSVDLNPLVTFVTSCGFFPTFPVSFVLVSFSRKTQPLGWCTQPFKILNDSNFPRECRVEGGCCQLTACQDRQSKPVIRKPAGDAPARCGTLQAYLKSNKITSEYQTVQTWKTSIRRIRLSNSCPTFVAFLSIWYVVTNTQF